MDKKYLMKSMAALMLVASVSSCVSEVDEVNQTELNAAIKENAELQLGITIPEGQTWEMSTQVTTDIAINLGLDQSYTVGIYDVDPRFSKNSTFYTLEKVNEGGSLNTSITLPNAMRTAYVAVYDSKLNLQTVKVVSIENDAIVANVGGTAANRAMRGVFTDDWSTRHTCNIDESKYAFSLPSGAVDVTNAEYWDEWKNWKGPNNASAYYVPEGYNGELDLNYRIEIKESTPFYNYGTITELKNVNYSGTVTFYNAGTLTYTVQSGNRHTVINTGVLTVKSFNNSMTIT